SVRPAARRQVHPRHVQGSGWGPRSATRFPGGSARCGTPDYQGATTEVDARAGRTLRTSPRPGRTPDHARDRVRRPEEGRQQRDEPMLMVIEYGKGRVFHATLGHDLPAMRCVGFRTTFARGTEWAATGKVTIPVPSDFPTAEMTSSRP